MGSNSAPDSFEISLAHWNSNVFGKDLQVTNFNPKIVLFKDGFFSVLLPI
jgi:hypothetical protein